MSINIDDIKLKNFKTSGCKINFLMEIKDSASANALHSVIVQMQTEVKMHGFRAGKVPFDVIEENFAEEIKNRTVNMIIKDSLDTVLEYKKIDPVSVPLVKNIDFSKTKPLVVEMEIEVAPEIEPKNYEKIHLTETPVKITDEMLRKEMDYICQRNARLETENENIVLAENNFAVVDYKVYEGEKELKNYSATGELVDMSESQTIKGLAENIKGAKKGEKRKFSGVIDKKPVTFEVTLNEIKKKILPELNEDFAKELNFENLEKLKTHIRTLLTEGLKNQSEEKISKQIEDHLLKHNHFDIPQSIVEHNLNNRLERLIETTGIKEITEQKRNEYKNRLRPAIERNLRVIYLVSAIAKKENIEITDEDIQTELENTLKRARTAKEEKEVKETFNSQKRHILLALTERKVFDLIKSKAKVTEV